MTDWILDSLLPAIDIAVFSRRGDGTFAPIAPAPSWFPRLASNTFPFLGHILDEANGFWRSGEVGSREFGPCAEVDEAGREFHYRVKALTIPRGMGQFLIFELDAGSDRLRTTLQKAREQTLAVERDRTQHHRIAAEIKQAATEILRVLEQLPADASTDARLVPTLRAKCEALAELAETLAE